VPLTTHLATDPLLLISLTSLLGLIIGSFLNVVRYRLPLLLEQQWQLACQPYIAPSHPPVATAPAPPRFDLIWPPSHCPQCQHPLGVLENIPLLSYLLQRGRCRHCAAPISRRYPLLELLTALVSGITAWHFGYGVALAAALLLSWSLLALAAIDLDTLLLPDVITLPLLWLGLLVALWGVFTEIDAAVIGAMAGYLTLWSIQQGYRLLTGRDGMGGGDLKLLALLGGWLGWQLLPLLLLLASLFGTLIGGVLLLRGHQRQQPMPFGPSLALAGWVTLLWGDLIVQRYQQWAWGV